MSITIDLGISDERLWSSRLGGTPLGRRIRDLEYILNNWDDTQGDYKLKPAEAALWLAKLRDPETKQTRAFLNVIESASIESPVGMCCLGVLSEVCPLVKRDAVTVGVETGDETGEFDGFGDRIHLQAEAVSYHGRTTMPPVEAGQWVGLTVSIESELAEINDAGATLLEIADLIERYLV